MECVADSEDLSVADAAEVLVEATATTAQLGRMDAMSIVIEADDEVLSEGRSDIAAAEFFGRAMKLVAGRNPPLRYADGVAALPAEYDPGTECGDCGEPVVPSRETCRPCEAEAGLGPEAAATLNRLRDLNEGDGVHRDDLIAAVVDEAGLHPDAVEEAITDVLMGGHAYEPDDEMLMPI